MIVRHCDRCSTPSLDTQTDPELSDRLPAIPRGQVSSIEIRAASAASGIPAVYRKMDLCASCIVTLQEVIKNYARYVNRQTGETYPVVNPS